MQIRIATYNIRLGIQEGLAAIADALAPERPEIIAIQEVGRNWIMGPGGDSTAELARRLGLDHYVFVPSLTQGAAHYGHAMLSAYPFKDATFERLPQGTDEPRTVLIATLEHPDADLRVVATHLSHVADRAAQTGRLLDVLDSAPELPTVLMGDLNASRVPSSGDEGFLDALAERTVDADPSATATFPASGPKARIDYILARDGALNRTVVGTNTTASDHLYLATTWTV